MRWAQPPPWVPLAYDLALAIGCLAALTSNAAFAALAGPLLFALVAEGLGILVGVVLALMLLSRELDLLQLGLMLAIVAAGSSWALAQQLQAPLTIAAIWVAAAARTVALLGRREEDRAPLMYGLGLGLAAATFLLLWLHGAYLGLFPPGLADLSALVDAAGAGGAHPSADGFLKVGFVYFMVQFAYDTLGLALRREHAGTASPAGTGGRRPAGP